MKSEEQIRKEWHEFFIGNKDRFTDSKTEAQKDSNKIYIGKEITRAKIRNPLYISEVQYRGIDAPFIAINWKRKP